MLWQIGSTLTNWGLNVSSGGYCTSEIAGSRVMVTHLLPYILIIPLCGQLNIQCSEPGCWLCFSVGYYCTWLWIRLSIPSCGAIPQDSCRTLMVSDQLKLNKFGLKCQQWWLLYKWSCWFQSYGNTLAALDTHYPIVWTVKHAMFGTRVLAVR